SISLPSSAMPNSESDIPLANDSAGASPGLLGLLARDEPGVVYVASLDSTAGLARADLAKLHGLLRPAREGGPIIIVLSRTRDPQAPPRGQLWWPAMSMFIPVH